MFLIRFVTRPLRVVALVAAVGLVLGGVWLWRKAHSSTPVSERAAVRSFRAESGAATPSTPGVPRAGVYTYSARGSEHGGAGPLSLTRSFPKEARYLVSPLRGGYERELDLSDEHKEGARIRVTGDWARVTWRRTEVSFLGFGRTDGRPVRPPSLELPVHPRVGQSWRQRYRAGDLPVVATGRVLRAEHVTVDARRLQALVIALHSVTGGAHPGTQDDTIWWSPALALPLRQEERLDIGGVVTLRSHVVLELRSLTPRT